MQRAVEVNLVRRAAVVLVVLSLCLALWGWLLWVDAGTKHMDSLPSSSPALVMSGGGVSGGPDRSSAWVAWSGAIGVAIAGVTLARRSR
jgi:hypothetical protein